MNERTKGEKNTNQPTKRQQQPHHALDDITVCPYFQNADAHNTQIVFS